MYHSLHIYIHSEDGIDKFLSRDFYHFMDKMSPYFSTYCYMRYWVGGPHVRFKFKLKSEEDFELIEAELSSTVQSFIRKNPLVLVDKKQFYTKDMLELEGMDEDALFWTPHGTVVESNYTPQIELFCQEAVCADISEVFYESTVLAQSLLGLPMEKKISESMQLFYWSIRTFGFDAQELKMLPFTTTVKSTEKADNLQIQACLEKAMLIEEMPLEYERYFDALRKNVDFRHPKFNRVIMYHLNMFFNRLGLPTSCAYAIKETLLEQEML